MPPWHADPAHGKFINDRRLSAADKDTILEVGDARARPKAIAADLPPRRSIRRLDHREARRRVPMTEDYPVPASGTHRLQALRGADQPHRGRWIQAYELKPAAPAVVHHVIVYARPPRRPAPAAAAAPPRRRRRPPALPGPPQRPFTFAPGMNTAARGPHRDGQAGDAQRSAGTRRTAWARSSARSLRARRSASTPRARRCGCRQARR